MRDAASRNDHGGTGEPVLGLVLNHGFDWTLGAAATARRAIARNVSQRGLGPETATTEFVENFWTRDGTNVFLGRLMPPGHTVQLADVLDPDG